MNRNVINRVRLREKYTLKRLAKDDPEEFNKYISKLDSQTQDILRKRFIWGMSTLRIATEVFYSKSTIESKIRHAFDELAKDKPPI